MEVIHITLLYCKICIVFDLCLRCMFISCWELSIYFIFFHILV